MYINIYSHYTKAKRNGYVSGKYYLFITTLKYLFFPFTLYINVSLFCVSFSYCTNNSKIYIYITKLQATNTKSNPK